MSNYYADRLGNINVVGGVARLDFLRVKDIESDSKKVNLEEAFRLVMPLEGVMQTIEVLEQMKTELLKQNADAEKTEAQ